jgi:hypothetical protein
MIQNLRSSVSSPLNGKTDIARFSSVVSRFSKNETSNRRSRPELASGEQRKSNNENRTTIPTTTTTKTTTTTFLQTSNL